MRSMIVLLALLCGCARAVQVTSTPPDTRVVALSGFTVVPPAESGWTRTAYDSAQVVFEKPGNGRLTARAIAIDAAKTTEAFMRATEAQLEAEVAVLEMQSVHYNQTRVGDAPCLQYDGIFRDPRQGTGQPEFLNMKGYVCRDPANAGRAARLEFALRSALRNPPNMDAMLVHANSFLTSTVFTKQ